MPKNNKNSNKLIIIFLSIVLFFLIILQSFFGTLYDYNFYISEFEKNSVNVAEREDIVLNIFDYFKGNEEISSEYFNVKERLHMVDVKNLISFASYVYYGLLFLLIGGFVYIKKFYSNKFKLYLKKIFIYSGIIVIGFTIISYFLRNQFGYFFIKFHELLFTNDLWLLDPSTDVLINLFPQQFFIDFVGFVFLKSIVFSLVLFGIAYFFRK